MKLVLQSKNIEITDAIRDYVNQKIEKAVSHFEQHYDRSRCESVSGEESSDCGIASS